MPSTLFVTLILIHTTHVYTSFIYLGPIENDNILDFLFGISIVIILLNVIIAIVTEAWEDASEEANKAFWSYRLDLILEKTRGVEEDGFFRASFCRCFVEIDDYYINHHTVGTTVTELKAKLALRYREKGVLSCLVIITKSLGWVILGFPTFGFLWVSTRIMCASIKLRTSNCHIFEHILCLFVYHFTTKLVQPFNQPKFFRQLLFTPQKPKEDDLKIKMDSLVEEIAECKKLAEDGQARYEKLQRDFDMQIKLMQKLLKNSSL